jgi:hypothetical protein
MRAMELEVSRMEGEVFELQARARQEFAKAQQLEGEAQLQAMELALNYRQQEKELMAKLQMFYDNLENKLTALTEMNKHSMKELDVLSRPRTTNGQG